MSENIKVGVNAIMIKDNKVLLGKRLAKAGFGQWGFPGGHLEFGESVTEAIIRELSEELGITASKVEFLHIINNPRKDDHYIQLVFEMLNWTGEVKLMEPHICEKWEWFDTDNLPENIFYAHEHFLPAFKGKIRILDIPLNK